MYTLRVCVCVYMYVITDTDIQRWRQTHVGTHTLYTVRRQGSELEERKRVAGELLKTKEGSWRIVDATTNHLSQEPRYVDQAILLSSRRPQGDE
jgi:hypothetical protein